MRLNIYILKCHVRAVSLMKQKFLPVKRQHLVSGKMETKGIREKYFGVSGTKCSADFKQSDSNTQEGDTLKR